MPLTWAGLSRRGTFLKTAALVCTACQLCVAAQTPPPAPADDLKQQFQSAIAAYQAGRHAEALETLQRLLRAVPESPDVNELAGLVLAATGQHDRAHPYLVKAVRLAPDNYEANHNLGAFYIQAGKLRDAIPYLARAQELRPTDYNNGYDLALAYVQTGDLAQARRQVLTLMKLGDKAELHSLLGDIEEKNKNYIVAAREYETAARMDPSDRNIFAWGAELLLHQTFDPAMAVFQAGLQRFPQSVRLHLGLGIALYGSGRADDAARKFCDVWDRDRSDPLPLTFAGRAYDSLSPEMADQVRSRLARFVEEGGRHAGVSYHYATALWKERQRHPETVDIAKVESLLRSAVALQPDNADVHLQLGIVYAEQRRHAEAAAQYQQALRIAPTVAATHYRLGQAFARMGDKARAQLEFATYERLQSREAADAQKENVEIQQFVYSMRGARN